MPEKDPNFGSMVVESMRQAMPFFTTILLSTWGAVVNHITILRRKKDKFRAIDLFFDIVISTFAGLLTFFFCKEAGISETMSAVLIAISGHMGTRAIAGFEDVYRRLVGAQDAKKN